MAKHTFAIREVVVYVDSTIVGLFKGGTIEVNQKLAAIYGGGDWKAVEIKEETEEVKFTLRKGLIRDTDTGFETTLRGLITRNTNGYLPAFTLDFRIVDGAGTTPFPRRKETLTGCKAATWKGTISEGDIVMEELSGQGISITGTSDTQASFTNPLT